MTQHERDGFFRALARIDQHYLNGEVDSDYCQQHANMISALHFLEATLGDPAVRAQIVSILTRSCSPEESPLIRSLEDLVMEADANYGDVHQSFLEMC